jgi:hypothetical protein
VKDDSAVHFGFVSDGTSYGPGISLRFAGGTNGSDPGAFSVWSGASRLVGSADNPDRAFGVYYLEAHVDGLNVVATLSTGTYGSEGGTVVEYLAATQSEIGFGPWVWMQLTGPAIDVVETSIERPADFALPSPP